MGKRSVSKKTGRSFGMDDVRIQTKRVNSMERKDEPAAVSAAAEFSFPSNTLLRL